MCNPPILKNSVNQSKIGASSDPACITGGMSPAPFHKCLFPFSHNNKVYKKCAMTSNPSVDNYYCSQYLNQRERNPRLVHPKPSRLTILELKNGTQVSCWEEGLGQTKHTQIKFGWCKVLLVGT